MYWETRSGQRLAAEALAHASAIDSNSPGLHILLGDVYRERWQYQEAEQEYRRALTLSPGNAGALLGLTLTLIANSEFDEAQKLTDEALKTNPDDPETNSVMGEILCSRQDFSGPSPTSRKLCAASRNCFLTFMPCSAECMRRPPAPRMRSRSSPWDLRMTGTAAFIISSAASTSK